jgi:hypothetical protein
MPDSPFHDSALRAGELLRLSLFLDQPDLDLDAVRLYVLDWLDKVYPLDYHVYRRRWHACAPGEEPGPLLGFLEWHALVSKWEEQAEFAELMGETAEVGELRRMLLVECDDM